MSDGGAVVVPAVMIFILGLAFLVCGSIIENKARTKLGERVRVSGVNQAESKPKQSHPIVVVILLLVIGLIIYYTWYTVTGRGH